MIFFIFVHNVIRAVMLLGSREEDGWLADFVCIRDSWSLWHEFSKKNLIVTPNVTISEAWKSDRRKIFYSHWNLCQVWISLIDIFQSKLGEKMRTVLIYIKTIWVKTVLVISLHKYTWVVSFLHLHLAFIVLSVFHWVHCQGPSILLRNCVSILSVHFCEFHE